MDQPSGRAVAEQCPTDSNIPDERYVDASPNGQEEDHGRHGGRLNRYAAKLGGCIRNRRVPYRLRRLKDLPASHLHPALIDSLLALSRNPPPRPVSYDTALALHRRYPIRDGYKYDPASKRARATERLKELRARIDLSVVSAALEVGAGDGQLALMLQQGGCQTTIVDVADWRDDEVRSSGIRFFEVGERTLYPLPDAGVDLVISFNTMEHVPDPTLTVNEMIRATRPGGHIYLSFGPLYNSPWGLHAYRTYYAPYAQFLLDEASLNRFIQANGIYDIGGTRHEFQFVNRWSLSEYRRLFGSLAGKATLIDIQENRDLSQLGTVYRHLHAFRGRSLSFDELTVNSLEVLLKVK